MECDQPPRAGTDDDLRAAIVAKYAADWWVVVAVPRGDLRHVRALVNYVQVTDLAHPTLPLDQAASTVLPVPGRCVIVARRTDTGWDFVATSGGLPRPTPLPPPVSPVPSKRARYLTPLTRGPWFGIGLRSGWPAVATPTYSLVVGPVQLEAGRTWLVSPWWRDRWWRVGGLVPVVHTRDRVTSVGLAGGMRSLRIAGYDELVGPTGCADVEWGWRFGHADRMAYVRGSAGFDIAVVPFSHGPGQHTDVYPLVEVDVGFRFAPF